MVGRARRHRLAWSTYSSHIRNHILPRWSGTALGDIARIKVKTWVNKTLRASLADKSAKDVLVLFSQILAEAVDEGLIGSNPCRKLRINFEDEPPRPHASTDEVDALAGRMHPDDGLRRESRVGTAEHRDALSRSTAYARDLAHRARRTTHPAAGTDGTQAQGHRRQLLACDEGDDRSDVGSAPTAVGARRWMALESGASGLNTLGTANVFMGPCSAFAPRQRKRPADEIIDRPV